MSILTTQLTLDKATIEELASTIAAKMSNLTNIDSKSTTNKLYTVPAAAEYSGFKESRLRDKIFKRTIDFVKIDGSVFFTKEILDAEIANGKVKSNSNK